MDLVAGRVWADERRPIRHLDPVLLIVAAALIGVGMFLVYSATHQTLEADGFDPFDRVKKQAVTAAIGIVIVLVIATFDYRFFKVYAGFIYAATLLLLAILQIPGMASPTGAYIDIPGAALLQISPAEFSKLGLLVPGLSLDRDAEQGGHELIEAYRTVGLTSEEFDSDRYIRLRRLRSLLDDGALDTRLRWRSADVAPASASSRSEQWG